MGIEQADEQAASPTAQGCAEEGSSAIISAVASKAGGASDQAGNEVDIDHHRFKLIEVIGRGAFGVVWLASERDAATEVAVKVVTAKDAAGFATATFEAEVLQMLAATGSKSLDHVPRYVAHGALRAGGPSGSGTVRLAMSFVPGGPLDRWLYGINDEDHKTVDVVQLVDGHLPGGQQGAWRLHGAASIVRDLLCQLSGVFGALQPVAFHRDVSSHNVLVDFRQGPEKPDFALIDFGLAVRSGSWSREWRHSNLAGDPRYWTPAAWMAFAFGFKYVSTHPNSGLQQQYLTRMDHFGLGVLALETLFALWGTGEAYEGTCPGMLEARAVWVKYWIVVIHMFQMFHMQGAHDVRQCLSQSQDEGVTAMTQHLKQLRQLLRAAAANPQNKHCAALLSVLADLIDENGTASWAELPPMLGEDLAAAPDPEVASAAVGRSSAALNESPPDPSFARATHSRIRSTGGTLDQELKRAEPEVGTAQRAPVLEVHGGMGIESEQTRGCLSPEPMSRSFSHARHSTG